MSGVSKKKKKKAKATKKKKKKKKKRKIMLSFNADIIDRCPKHPF